MTVNSKNSSDVTRILVVGHKGMLGQELMKVFGQGYKVDGVDIEDVDIRGLRDLRHCIADCSPDVVINSAAYTDVDGAESESEAAFAVNAVGAKNVAAAAKEVNARLFYYSTDFVFDGTKKTPYSEDDEPNPNGVYARSKREGEIGVLGANPKTLIIRTAWLYGAAGRNFIETIIQLADYKDELRVVDDQRGSPTWTRHLAEATKALVSADAQGIVHVTNSGDATWFGLTKKILELIGRSDIKVVPITTEELGRAAPRPAYSVLDTSKYSSITGNEMPRWEQALKSYIDERAADR